MDTARIAADMDRFLDAVMADEAAGRITTEARATYVKRALRESRAANPEHLAAWLESVLADDPIDWSKLDDNVIPFQRRAT